MSLFKKKSATENLEELRDITDDVIESDFVPYACHWDENTIATKNGELLQIIKITGFAHEHLENDGDDSDLRAKIRQAIKTSVSSTKFAFWIHTIRRKKSLKTGGEYKRDFSGYLNNFWNEKNDWEHKFTNEVYITIIREGEGAAILDFKTFARGMLMAIDRRRREENMDIARDELTAVTKKMLPTLESYGARILKIVKRDGKHYSEPCEFLDKLITLTNVEFPVCDIDLSESLTDYDVTFGYNAMEVRLRSNGKRRFGAILTLREYRELTTAQLERLLEIPAEYIISQSFEFLPAKIAVRPYEYQKELFEASKATELSEKIGLTGIVESNKGTATDFGQHQINIFLLADSIRALEAGVANAATALAALGMTPMREDISQEECYWAQLPANFEFIRRMRPINTARIGGLANLSNFPAGSKKGNHWGPAVTTFHTAARTPYFFNFHNGDNGHTALIGKVGAGKSVLLNFLLSESRKFDNRIFFFDVNRSAEIFLRSLGGAYYNPYPKADTRTYAQISLNPFALPDSAKTQLFLRDWMLTLISLEGHEGLAATCEKAIATTMGLENNKRSLVTCVDFMRAENAAFAALFAPWTEGEFVGLFSGNGGLDFAEKICGFEMGDVLSHEEAIIPVLSYLLHTIAESLDGTPTIIVMSEAWQMLDNAFFGPRISAWLDYLRTKNTLVIFATDHLDEVSSSPINKPLFSKLATQIFLPDSDADDLYGRSFGLNEKEISFLAMMNLEDRHFLLKRAGETIVGELSLAGMDDIIAVLSATPEKLKIMESAIESKGLGAAEWMPKFLEMNK